MMDTHRTRAFRTAVVLGLAIMVLVPGLGCQRTEPDCIQITYVGNTGFLAEWSGRKVLIDGLCSLDARRYYDLPDSAETELILSARAPFDAIDLVLVTHHHRDHFDPEVVQRYLVTNPRTELICSGQAHRLLQALSRYDEIAARVHEAAPPPGTGTAVEAGGMTTRVFKLRHGPYWETDSTGAEIDRHAAVENLGYVVDLGGRKLFHGGDDNLDDTTALRRFRLPDDSIQVAFIQWWAVYPPYDTQWQVVRDYISPAHVVLMHIPPDRREELAALDTKDFGNVEIFRDRLTTRALACRR